ncbi:MAG: hypothetical protein Kow00121_27510 [Elainellaceae cyanobacterium]
MDDSQLIITPLTTSTGTKIWTFGSVFGAIVIASKAFVAFADYHISTTEFSQLSFLLLLFMCWLYSKPIDSLSQEILKNNILSRFKDYLPNLDLQSSIYLRKAQSRMLELHKQHMITQEYTLPFPYLCQIYHLLNLKHLEQVHNFSLSNLRVVKISQFQTTEIGGKIKFQTILESSVNALRIWRQPIVEVDLILHTPHTVELSIPVYNDKRITVIFNVLPLSDVEHKLFIDIYSNLSWPKPILQMLLHVAAGLTLFEDLPYLRKLAERNLDRLVNLNKISNHETMLLFKRFVDLYGATGIRQPELELVD